MISGNESSRPLGNHDRRHMRIRRWDVRHYRCIDDAKAGYAVDSAGWVDHSSGSGIDAHCAGADRVVVGPCLPPHPRPNVDFWAGPKLNAPGTTL